MTIVSGDGSSLATTQSFNAKVALYAARGYHHTAGSLFGSEVTYLGISTAGNAIGYVADMGGVPQEKPHRPVRVIVGEAISAVVLEALALELVLKVKLHHAGKRPPKMHNHADLFAKLAASERQQAGQRFQVGRQPDTYTLEEVLANSAPAFERWRYAHEHQQLEASMSDMRQAFEALAYGL